MQERTATFYVAASRTTIGGREGQSTFGPPRPRPLVKRQLWETFSILQAVYLQAAARPERAQRVERLALSERSESKGEVAEWPKAAVC